MIPTLLHYSLIVLVVILGGSLCFILNTYRNVTFRSDALQRRSKWIQGGIYGAIASMTLLLIAYSWFGRDITESRGTWFWRSQLLVVISLAILSLVWITVPQSSIELEEPEYQNSLAVIRYLSYSILALCVGWMGWSVYQYVLEYRRLHALVPMPPDPFYNKKVGAYYPAAMRDHYYYRPELNPDLQMRLVSDLQSTYDLPREFSAYYVELVDGTPNLEYDDFVVSLLKSYYSKINSLPSKETTDSSQLWNFIDSSYTLYDFNKRVTEKSFLKDLGRGIVTEQNKTVRHVWTFDNKEPIFREDEEDDVVIKRAKDQLSRVGIIEEDEQYLIMNMAAQGIVKDLCANGTPLFFPPSVFYSGALQDRLVISPICNQVLSKYYPRYLESFIRPLVLHPTIKHHSDDSVVFMMTYYSLVGLFQENFDYNIYYMGIAVLEAVIYLDLRKRVLHRFYRLVKWSSDAIRDLCIAIYYVGQTKHQVSFETLNEMFRHICLKEMYDKYRDTLQLYLAKRYKEVIAKEPTQNQLNAIEQINLRLPKEIQRLASKYPTDL
jgi:hypothetical protein